MLVRCPVQSASRPKNGALDRSFMAEPHALALIAIRSSTGARNQALLRPKPDPCGGSSIDVRVELWSVASCLPRKGWLPARLKCVFEENIPCPHKKTKP